MNELFTMTRARKSLARVMFAFFLFAFVGPLQAQKSRVDSIILLLNKSRIKTGIDSATFQKALNLINQSILTDSLLNEIENEAAKFTKGTDEDLSYFIKFGIFERLCTVDFSKAITYGKLNFEKLKTSKTPLSFFFRDNFLIDLRSAYRNSQRLTEGFKYFSEQLNEFQKQKDSAGMGVCHYVLGGFFRITGLYDQAIYQGKKAISYMNSASVKPPIFKMDLVDGRFLWLVNLTIVGACYIEEGNYGEALKYCLITFNEVKNATASLLDSICLEYSAVNIAYAKILFNQLDSVGYYLDRASSALAGDQYDHVAFFLQLHAFYEIKRGNLDSAEMLLQQCKELIHEKQLFAFNSSGTVSPDYYLALIRVQQKKYNDAVELLKKDTAWVRSQRFIVLRDEKLLASVYEMMGDNEKAKEMYKAFISLRDSVLADQNKYRTASFEVEQQMNADEISINKLQSDNRIFSLTRNFTIGISLLLLLLATVIYYRFKSKQRANKLLEKTLSDLKSTQAQLIQSEKMASLGELTAGIAHEIQNPLNFVNNFSDVNSELVDELQHELKAGKINDALAISNNIKDNEQKINHHGKRADAIVKGMLQHSKASAGQKELTNINALCDEYLRLAYHGLRAKDKSFNADIKTEFDNNVGKINIVPQDVGRVLLNLINNAFYAVNEKAKLRADSYEPLVSVSTKRKENKVEIKIEDNGNGIPQKILDKIFQPFFTTKPTGQGTGLGLSLAYDIIKAHGGDIKVETKEGEGSEFVIQLPAISNVP